MLPNESEQIIRFIDNEGIDSLEIVLKITERCNIACTYCYYFFGGDESYSSRPPVISIDRINDLVSFVERSLFLGIKKVRLVFHGGEPLLMKKERFSEMLKIIENGLNNKVILDFSIQTNAILIDEEWINIFSKHNIFVGVSIDGPEYYNDMYRIDKKGNGTYKDTIKGVNRLFSAHSAGLIQKPGVICVINPNFNAGVIYNHLTYDLGFDNLHFLYQDLTHSGITADYLHKVKIFTSDLVQAWVADVGNKVKVRFLADYINKMSLRPFERDVLYKYNQMKSLIVTVDSSGDVGPEDTLRSIAPGSFGCGVNIKNSTLRDLFYNNDFMNIYKSEHSIPNDCFSCCWKSICKGGHLKNRYNDLDQSFNNKSIYCDVITDTLYTLAALVQKNGMSLDDLSRRIESYPLQK